MTDYIETSIDLKAPPERVWQALTDSEEFGSWFGVKLEQPFALCRMSRGHITHPGHEHLRWAATVVEMRRLRNFAFTWHPYAVEPGKDYRDEPPTLVEFRLEAIPGGTRLHVRESGFDALPAERRDLAFRMNAQGWSIQMQNIQAHVDG